MPRHIKCDVLEINQRALVLKGIDKRLILDFAQRKIERFARRVVLVAPTVAGFEIIEIGACVESIHTIQGMQIEGGRDAVSLYPTDLITAKPHFAQGTRRAPHPVLRITARCERIEETV
jgi:hypothetical protein